MGEFEDFYKGAPLQQSETQQSAQKYNTQLSGETGGEFTNYYKQQDEQKKARQQANLTRINAKTTALRADAEESTSPIAYAKAAGEGLATGLGDIADAATLGGYRKVRDYALGKVAPDGGKAVRDMETEQHAPVTNNPLLRAAQIGGNALNSAVGYGMGAPALLGKAGMAATRALAPKVGPVLADLAGGGVAGGLTGGAESAIAGDDPNTILKRAGAGAVLGGVTGTALGIGGRAIAKAPARAIESEMAGLTEGVTTRGKIKKFLPKEESIRAELNPDKTKMPPQEHAEALAIRRAIKDDPQEALPAVQKKLGKVAEEDLEPFYTRMEHAKVDGVELSRINDNLAVVRDHFTASAEKAQRAAVQSLMDDMEKAASGTGVVPARVLREEATAYQGQGFANVPVFGEVTLSKQAKQGMGGALRESIAEHLDDMAPGGGLGDAFRNANKRVSAWYAIKDLMEEKVARIKTKSPTLMDQVGKVASAVTMTPAKFALKHIAPSIGPGAESFDRNILAPMSQNPSAQALGRGVQQTAPGAAASQFDMLQRAREEKLRKDREAAGMLYQE